MTATAQALDASVRPATRRYVLFILTIVYVLSFMDRQILSILLEDLRAEFAFSDLELGLLSGLAFAMFYGVLGVPVARLADRTNRAKLVAVAITAWSVATAACAAATGFFSLFLARTGVGVGEAGGTAPSISLLADYYNRFEMPRAMAFFGTGPVFGAILGLGLGGTIAEAWGWRWAFVVAGLPGVLVGIIVWLTIRDPRPVASVPTPAAAAELKFGKALRTLLGNRNYVLATLQHTTAIAMTYAIASWLPSLLHRSFELERSQVILYTATVFIAGGLLGTVSGGLIAERLVRRTARWQYLLPAIGSICAIPILIAGFVGGFAIGPTVALLALGNFLMQWNFAPLHALIQSVVEPKVRTFAASIVLLVATILGLAFGPAVIGLLSDGYAGAAGQQSLAWALASFVAIVPVSACIGLWGAKWFRESDLAD